MKKTRVRFTILILLFSSMTTGGLMASPFTYLSGDEAMQRFGSYQTAPVVDPEVIAAIEDFQLTPKQERKQAIHRLAAKLGLPSKKISHGMDAIKRDFSYHSNGSVRFSSHVILDWDEIGFRSGLTGFRGTEALMEVSSRYQGIIIRKTTDRVERRFVVELDKVSYTASIPLEDLSFSRVLSGLNIFSFFTKK